MYVDLPPYSNPLLREPPSMREFLTDSRVPVCVPAPPGVFLPIPVCVPAPPGVFLPIRVRLCFVEPDAHTRHGGSPKKVKMKRA